MAEILFISDVYIKKYTPINDAVDSGLLYPAVYLAQDKYLQPWLGTALYEKLKADIAGGTLAGDYQTLVNDYCQKVVLWWAMVEAMPSLTYKIDNGTMVQRTSEDTQPVSNEVLKETILRWRSNAEYYTGLLVDYLCANSSKYPEYSANVWPQRPPLQLRGSAAYAFTKGNTAQSTVYGNKRLDYLP